MNNRDIWELQDAEVYEEIQKIKRYDDEIKLLRKIR